MNANILKVMHNAFLRDFDFSLNLQCNKEQRNQVKITEECTAHYLEYISIYLPIAIVGYYDRL